MQVRSRESTNHYNYVSLMMLFLISKQDISSETYHFTYPILENIMQKLASIRDIQPVDNLMTHAYKKMTSIRNECLVSGIENLSFFSKTSQCRSLAKNIR